MGDTITNATFILTISSSGILTTPEQLLPNGNSFLLYPHPLDLELEFTVTSGFSKACGVIILPVSLCACTHARLVVRMLHHPEQVKRCNTYGVRTTYLTSELYEKLLEYMYCCVPC